MGFLSSRGIQEGLPAGIVLPYAGNSAPSGWLLCDGSAIDRITYAKLFAAISTSYGTGDGENTFNLPNTQGVFLRGAGSQVISASTYSATRGTKQNDQNLSHSHAVNSHNHGGGDHGHGGVVSYQILNMSTNAGTGVKFAVETGSPFDGGNVNSETFSAYGSGATISSESPGTNSVGGSETRPANLGVNHIIKT